MLHSGFCKDGNVREIKAAQYHPPFLLHSLRKARQVLKQDVAVDVGYEEVGLRLPFEHRTVAYGNLYPRGRGQGARGKGQENTVAAAVPTLISILLPLAPCSLPHRWNMVQQQVVLRVLHAPFVDVVGKNACRSTFDGHDSQYACAGSCIDDVLVLQVELGQSAQDEARRLVASRAESHAGRDDDVVMGRRHIGVLHVVNHYQSSLPLPFQRRDDVCSLFVLHPSFGGNEGGFWYYNRLKPFFLPDLVPIFVGSFGQRITDFDIGQKEVPDDFLHRSFAPLVPLDISQQAVIGRRKRLEAYLGECCREEVNSRLAEGLQCALDFVVLHNPPLPILRGRDRRAWRRFAP